MRFSIGAAVLAVFVTAAPVHAAWELPPLDKVLNYQPKQPLQPDQRTYLRTPAL